MSRKVTIDFEELVALRNALYNAERYAHAMIVATNAQAHAEHERAAQEQEACAREAEHTAGAYPQPMPKPVGECVCGAPIYNKQGHSCPDCGAYIDTWEPRESAAAAIAASAAERTARPQREQFNTAAQFTDAVGQWHKEHMTRERRAARHDQRAEDEATYSSEIQIDARRLR